jgi:hypothetical protein
MFGCRVLDAMRSCYSYFGTYQPEGFPEPVEGIIWYYFICTHQEPQYGVPYGSHFYQQGHVPGEPLVKPEDYHWKNGQSPFTDSHCRCCPDHKPNVEGCPCPNDHCRLTITVDSSPWGSFTVSVRGTFSTTSWEYQDFEQPFPEGSGYELQAISYDEDSLSWVTHWSTPDGYQEIPIVVLDGEPCTWQINSGGPLGADIVLGETTANPYVF